MVPSVGDLYRSTLHLLFPLNRLFALGVCLDHQRFDNYIPLLRLLRLLPEQCLSIDLLPFQRPANVRGLRPLLPGFHVIVPINIEDLIDPCTEFRVLNRETGVTLHEIRRLGE
jgi:hypothetical protein